MTERRMKIERRRNIEKRNAQKRWFRNTVKFLLIAVMEIAAAAFILHCKESQTIGVVEIMFVLIAGMIPAYTLWQN